MDQKKVYPVEDVQKRRLHGVERLFAGRTQCLGSTER